MGLFKPAWMSDKADKALSAVDATHDEATLRRIVEQAPNPGVRLRAARKLNDQQVYRHYAENDPSDRFRFDMALNVDDDEFLDAFAKRPENRQYGREVQMHLLARDRNRRDVANRQVLTQIPVMDDTDRLVEIAVSDKAKDVMRTSLGYAAFRPANLNAPEPHTTEDEMRAAAIERLAGLGADDVLAQVARSRTATLSGIAPKAASKIADQRKLVKLLLDASLDGRVHTAAMAALTDRDLLEQLANMQVEGRPGATPVNVFAARRLDELRSQEICHGNHDWELVKSEGREVGEFRYLVNDYRCRRCGITSVEEQRI